MLNAEKKTFPQPQFRMNSLWYLDVPRCGNADLFTCRKKGLSASAPQWDQGEHPVEIHAFKRRVLLFGDAWGIASSSCLPMIEVSQ